MFVGVATLSAVRQTIGLKQQHELGEYWHTQQENDIGMQNITTATTTKSYCIYWSVQQVETKCHYTGCLTVKVHGLSLIHSMDVAVMQCALGQ